MEVSTRPRRPAQLGFLQRPFSASRPLGAAKTAERLSLVIGLQRRAAARVAAQSCRAIAIGSIRAVFHHSGSLRER